VELVPEDGLPGLVEVALGVVIAVARLDGQGRELLRREQQALGQAVIPFGGRLRRVAGGKREIEFAPDDRKLVACGGHATEEILGPGEGQFRFGLVFFEPFDGLQVRVPRAAAMVALTVENKKILDGRLAARLRQQAAQPVFETDEVPAGRDMGQDAGPLLRFPPEKGLALGRATLEDVRRDPRPRQKLGELGVMAEGIGVPSDFDVDAEFFQKIAFAVEELAGGLLRRAC
jgi:hypothetical protein